MLWATSYALYRLQPSSGATIGYFTADRVMFAAKLIFLLLLLVCRLPQSRQQQCQKGLNFYTVLNGYCGADNTVAPAYSGIEPNTNDCHVSSDRTVLMCQVGSVLNDGDIGPTHSVNMSDPDQVRRFFCVAPRQWHSETAVPY